MYCDNVAPLLTHTLFLPPSQHGVAEVYRDDVAKWSVLSAVREKATVRAALATAGLESRREEAHRNRWQINARRAVIPPM
jgi:hypothetical protein